MASIPDIIYSFFEKRFKKRLTLFLSIPLIFSAVYLVDFHILPDSNKDDVITQIFKITIPNSVGGTSVRTNKKVGYQYITNNKFKFSSQRKNIEFSEIQITHSPIFNTVKSVILNNKHLEISSGFNGINKVLMLACNFTILISIIYMYSVRNISENARLNLVFLNLFTLALWFYIIIKFGI